MICGCTLDGDPVTWKRARSQGARRWTDPQDRRYRDAIRYALLAARPRGWPLEARYSVTLVVSVRRDVGDVDNYAKSWLDAGKGILWDDDASVVELYVRRVRADRGSVSVLVEADEVLRRSSKKSRAKI
jgi:Holliday junction resolvase RusA-like endonuclease